MATRFSRITVAGPAKRIDLSLPSDVPMAELLRLVGVPAEAGPRRWVLAHPVAGPIAPEMSLREAGILDGDTLYLREHEDGSGAPYAEDAAEEAAAEADGASGQWTVERTMTALAVATGAWLTLLGPVALLGRAAGDPDTMAAFLAAGAGVALLAALVARQGKRPPLVAALSFALTGLLTATGLAMAMSYDVGALGASGALLGAFVALWLAPQVRAVFAAIVTSAVLVGGWALLMQFGLSPGRGAAVVAVISVALVGVCPRIAVSLTGLGRVSDQVAEGEPVRRSEVRGTTRRTRVLLAWLLVGVAAGTLPLLVALAATSGVWPRVFGLVVAGAFLTRARIYSHAAAVIPVAAVGVGGLLIVATGWAMEIPQPLWLFTAVLAGTVLLFVLAMAQYREIARVRIRMVVDRCEVLLFIVAGPLLLAVFNAYAWAADVVRS